jgi:2-polyprenyl-6-methoxyphenol hydroxylase-like FAD-dependent oxidoreductase
MYIGKQAVVIGAGIGGLAAARSLVGRFEKIVVLERDILPEAVEPRAGIPQGRHPHVILPGGMESLSQLWEGFTETLRAAGAKESDFGSQTYYHFPGQQALPFRKLGIRFFKCTRPLIENTVRNLVKKEQDVIILDGHRVTEIVPTQDGNAVRAVCCETRDGKEEIYEAELVIDASNRGELTLEFLRSTGRSTPEETVIGVNLNYATAVLEFEERDTPEFHAMLAMPNAPESSRMGLILAREDNYMFAALGGRSGDAPPIDWPDYLDFARSLVTDSLYKILATGKPRGKIVQYGFTENRRRHFERCANWPRGLVPLGDTICRFNPVYGQGMTAAVKEAVMLRDLLKSRQHDAQPLTDLFEALMAEANPMLDNIWALSAIPDLAYPDARGERPANLQEALEFNVAVHRAAFLDADVHTLLFQVIALLKPGAALQDEAVAERIKRLAAEFQATHNGAER